MKIVFLILCGAFSLGTSLFGQTSMGPKGGITSVNSTSVGTYSWTNLSNFQSLDGSDAICSITLGAASTGITNYFAATNFSFTIPTTATLTGIAASVTRKSSGLGVGSSVTDYSVAIIKGGTIISSNQSSGASWPSSMTTANFGGSSNTWGTTWTPAEVNASNFGIAISASIYSGIVGLSIGAEIDYISMTVYYNDIVLPIELSNFEGIQKGRSVDLNWETATENNTSHFIVERSVTSNTCTWETIAQTTAAGNSESIQMYRAEDSQPMPINYYRLKQVDKDQHISYSPIIAVECTPEKNSLTASPIPATDFLTLTDASSIEQIDIRSTDGKQLCSYSPEDNDGHLNINISGLAPGIYFLNSYTETNVRSIRFIKLPTH